MKVRIALEEFEIKFGAEFSSTLIPNETIGLNNFLTTHLNEKARCKRAKRWVYILRSKIHEPRVFDLKKAINGIFSEPDSIEHFVKYISEVCERLNKAVHVYLEGVLDEPPNLRKIFSDVRERSAFKVFLTYQYGEEPPPFKKCYPHSLKM